MSQFIEMFKDSHKVGLGQLATFINGSAFKPEDWSTEGLPIVRIQNLNDTSCEYNFYNGDCSKKIVIDNGDVLVSWSATLGVFIWDKGKALLNQHIFKVVFDKIEIDRDFFIYTVSVALDKMSQHTHGSTMKHIVKSEFNKFPVACPTLSEQKEFAQIAQQADKSEFDGIKSQFIEMFEGDKYPHINLEEISIDWLKGQSFKKNEMNDDGNNLCIHYGELFTKYGPIIKNVISRTNTEPKRVSKAGDILFPASDVTPNGLARCSMLNEDNVILGGDIIVLRPKGTYNPGYLSYAINQQTSQLLQRVNGGVVKHMSAKALKTVHIPMPPRDKQDEYIAVARQADKSEL